jgi:aminoglycoside phosphotransferase (APT) family kinase protein
VIAAVVDWEISTLGDPLADLAYAMNQWMPATDTMPTGSGGATAAPGFPTREALLDRYAERTGRDLSNLGYYVGFNRWKSAAIVHGVYARYMEGKKSTEGVDLPEMRQRIVRTLDLAEEAVNRL